ncbi:iron ABC transporter permease [Desulfurococcaceae archaeon MEX13E-LK6-19]|nr:iron ABC transporter permease [Desulfurococcaceae archaeon MEX13E-LK6-19]
MSLSEERYLSLKDFLVGTLVVSIIYYIAYDLIPPDIMKDIEIYFWLGMLVWVFIAYRLGFDPYRLIYSFSWSFVSMIGIIYIFIVLMIGIPGIPRVIAFFLLSIVAMTIWGHIKSRIDLYKQKQKWIKERGVRAYKIIALQRRVKTATFKLDYVLISFIVISFVILIVFLIVPLLMMLIHAFEVPEGKPWYYWFEVIFKSRTYIKLRQIVQREPWTWQPYANYFDITGIDYGILLNSLINSAIVTSVATILGIIVGFVLARYQFPGRRILRIIAIIPLFVTPFINAYAIKLLFGLDGLISQITSMLFGFKIRIHELAGVALAQIMAFYPIVYLNAYSSFVNIDPSMEEQAENLGAKGLKLFLTVTLPLALPGIAAGSIIVFIFSLEDLGAPIVFQERRLISYKIFSSLISEYGQVSPEIAALGFILLGLAVLGFITIRSYVGMRAYAMISRGGRWNPRERKLGWKGLLAVYLLIFPLVIFTALPQITVALMALNIIPVRQFTLQLDQATLKYFIEIFTVSDIAKYVRNTIIYATVATIIATIISLITTYAVSRAKIKIITPLLDTLITIPIAIPGLVIAIGYFYFYSTFFTGTPLDPTSGPLKFQAWAVLITAYSIRKLPFVARSVYAGFQQVHETLEEAALNLGAKRLKVLGSIVLPLIVLNMISGAMVGFIYISTEVSTSITIGSFNQEQAPMTWYMMHIYKGGTTEGIPYTAAMGLLLILIQLAVVLIITLGFKQRYAFIGAA